MKTLDDVREYLSSINNINCGGCGIAAYAMYLWLKENNQLDKAFMFVLGYTSYSEENYINNQNVLRDKNGQGVGCSHMFIFHNGRYIDSDGIINPTEYKWVQHVKEEWFIKNCVSNAKTWNYTFDRKNIPLIEEKLKINFNL